MSMQSDLRVRIRKFLTNNLTAARAVSQTAGLLTRSVRRMNVAMFHPGRCGSTVVGILLNQHPKIHWVGEIFACIKSRYGSNSWIWDNPVDMVKLKTNLSSSRVFGFEMKMKHFKDVNIGVKRMISILNALNYNKYIILKRKNYLKKEISALVGKKIGKWNTKKEISPPSVNVPINGYRNGSIIYEFIYQDKFYKKLDDNLNGKDKLKISYEDDIKYDPKKSYRKMLEYLGLKYEDAEIQTKKINKEPIQDRVSNFNEVNEVLSGTKYEWMLYDE